MSEQNTCDLEMTKELFSLFEIPREERDQDWLEDFFSAIPTASLQGFKPQIHRGPDGFPYLLLSLPESGEEFDAFCVVDAVPYCLKHGCGIAVYASPNNMNEPEWVFTFGNLWAFENFGNFIGDPKDELPTPETQAAMTEAANEPREIQVAAPPDEYLPSYARSALSRFLREAIGLENARVALIVDPIARPTRSLMFADLQPESFEKQEHFVQVMQAIRWFLPATRGLMAGIPQVKDHAVPL